MRARAGQPDGKQLRCVLQQTDTVWRPPALQTVIRHAATGRASRSCVAAALQIGLTRYLHEARRCGDACALVAHRSLWFRGIFVLPLLLIALADYTDVFS